MPDRPTRVKFIKWDSTVCVPNDEINEHSPNPDLKRFADDVTNVLSAGGTVLTTVPLSEPGTAALVALVYDD